VDPRSRLVALSGRAEARALAEGALWIAAEAHQDLDVQHWLGQIDALGYRAAERVAPEMDVDRAASAVARLLFEGRASGETPRTTTIPETAFSTTCSTVA